jgi:hypothetical protein
MSIPDFGEPDSSLFAAEKKAVAHFKKAVLMVAGAAVQKLMMSLSKEQEILMNVSDMISYVYCAESTLLRVEKLVAMKGEDNCALQLDIMRTYLFDAADKINKCGKDALMGFAEGDEMRMMLMGLRRFTKMEAFNTKDARQRIATKLIEENAYCF